MYWLFYHQNRKFEELEKLSWNQITSINWKIVECVKIEDTDDKCF